MSGSVVAPRASLPMARVAPASTDATRAPSSTGASSAQPHDAGSLRWQRARLVLDQHQRERDAATQPEQVLPVRAELADLLPLHGLRRGSTVVVRGSTTLLLALLAEATAGGSWAAVVGMPNLGLVAAAELGVAIPRLALIPNPGTNFADVVAALLDGIDLVAVAPGAVPTHRRAHIARSNTTLARRLSARARHRKSVLLAFGDWPGADLELTCTGTRWSGLGNGNGYLKSRESTITVHGRGIASRPTTHKLTLPAAPTPNPTPLRRPISVAWANDRPTITPPDLTSPIGPATPINSTAQANQLGVVAPTDSANLAGPAAYPRSIRPVSPINRATLTGLSSADSTQPADLTNQPAAKWPTNANANDLQAVEAG
ncbi:MAG TPA: hypothetical protein VGD84_19290 [Pseudonocardiaceae bacterium]